MRHSSRLPSIRQLQCFVAVTEELNFRRAAQRLNLSQPPLSRQVRNLEDLLRVRLIERDTHRVRLTSAGESFAEKARELLATLDETISELQRRERSREADVWLGLTSVIDFSLIPRVHRLLGELEASRRLRLEHAYSKQLLARLGRGEIDLALVGKIAEQDATFAIQRIADDPLMIALPQAYDAARRKRLTFDDLAGLTLFWFPRQDNPAFYDDCAAVFAEHGYDPPRRPEPDEHVKLLAKIAAGQGVAFLPASLGATRRTGVVYRRFVPEIEARLTIPLQLVWRPRETRPEVLQMLKRLLEADEEPG